MQPSLQTITTAAAVAGADDSQPDSVEASASDTRGGRVNGGRDDSLGDAEEQGPLSSRTGPAHQAHEAVSTARGASSVSGHAGASATASPARSSVGSELRSAQYGGVSTPTPGAVLANHNGSTSAATDSRSTSGVKSDVANSNAALTAGAHGKQQLPPASQYSKAPDGLKNGSNKADNGITTATKDDNNSNNNSNNKFSNMLSNRTSMQSLQDMNSTVGSIVPFPFWAGEWFSVQAMIDTEFFQESLLVVSPIEKCIRLVTVEPAPEDVETNSGIEYVVRRKLLFEDIPAVEVITTSDANHMCKFAIRTRRGKFLIMRAPSAKECEAIVRYIQAGPLSNVARVSALEFRYPARPEEEDAWADFSVGADPHAWNVTVPPVVVEVQVVGSDLFGPDKFQAVVALQKWKLAIYIYGDLLRSLGSDLPTLVRVSSPVWVLFVSALEIEDLPPEGREHAPPSTRREELLQEPCPFEADRRLCLHYAYTDADHIGDPPAIMYAEDAKDDGLPTQPAPSELAFRIEFPDEQVEVAGGTRMNMRDLWSFYIAGLTTKAQARTITQLRSRGGSGASLPGSLQAAQAASMLHNNNSSSTSGRSGPESPLNVPGTPTIGAALHAGRAVHL